MHPFVKILSFILIILLTNIVHGQLVWMICFLTCAVAVWISGNDFLRATRRMRWLFISIFIIYAFGSPGEYVQYFPNNLSPTFEGISLGLLQIAKLLTAISALMVLFGSCSKDQLLSALNHLLSPLEMLGFNTNRFIVRLVLTLNYVEALTINEKVNLSFGYLDNKKLDEVEDYPQQVIEFPYFSLKFLDKLQVFIIACIFLMLLTPSSHTLIDILDKVNFLP